MNSRQDTWIVFVLIPLCLGVQNTIAYAQARYTITDLGVLNGYAASQATALNDKGVIVGNCITPHEELTDYRAFLYRNNKMIDLGVLAEDDATMAYSINNPGHVVGTSGSLPFLYRNNRMINLRPLLRPLGYQGVPKSINDRGQIIGRVMVDTTDPNTETTECAFLYSDHRLISLSRFGSAASDATAINQRGWVVGNLRPGAFLYRNDQLIDLGVPRGFKSSNANGLNDKGEIVGHAHSSEVDKYLAFVYRRGKFTLLGTLGGKSSVALGINNRGQIVGYSYISGRVEIHAFLYEKGKMIDLNILLPEGSGWELRKATAINNRGQIVGDGICKGNRRAFLLTPVK